MPRSNPSKASFRIISKNSLILIIDTLLLISFLYVHYLFYQGKNPHIENSQYRMLDKDWQSFDHPLRIPTESKSFEIQLDLYSSIFDPQFYRMQVDDCLQELRINGIAILDEDIQFCTHGVRAELVDLRPYINNGWNEIYALISDKGGRAEFSMRAALSTRHPIVMGVNILLLGSVFAYVAIRILR